MDKKLLKMIYAAVCLALALVLPFLTGSLPQIGRMLSPMHIPVLLAGYLCGGPLGAAVGFVAPLLRSLLFGAPVLFPNAVGMAFELAAYGFFAALFYKILPKKTGYLYLGLLASMVIGRLVWGGVRFLIAGLTATEFPFSAFLAGAVLDSIPGIIAVLILVPLLVLALRRAHLMPDQR